MLILILVVVTAATAQNTTIGVRLTQLNSSTTSGYERVNLTNVVPQTSTTTGYERVNFTNVVLQRNTSTTGGVNFTDVVLHTIVTKQLTTLGPHETRIKTESGKIKELLSNPMGPYSANDSTFYGWDQWQELIASHKAKMDRYLNLNATEDELMDFLNTSLNYNFTLSVKMTSQSSPPPLDLQRYHMNIQFPPNNQYVALKCPDMVNEKWRRWISVEGNDSVTIYSFFRRPDETMTYGFRTPTNTSKVLEHVWRDTQGFDTSRPVTTCSFVGTNVNRNPSTIQRDCHPLPLVQSDPEDTPSLDGCVTYSRANNLYVYLWWKDVATTTVSPTTTPTTVTSTTLSSSTLSTVTTVFINTTTTISSSTLDGTAGAHEMPVWLWVVFSVFFIIIVFFNILLVVLCCKLRSRNPSRGDNGVV